jgi:hypothetical protein
MQIKRAGSEMIAIIINGENIKNIVLVSDRLIRRILEALVRRAEVANILVIL